MYITGSFCLPCHTYNAMKPSESEVQDALVGYLRRKSPAHRLVVPNVRVFPWESDLVTVTKSRYAWDLEVKTSRSDYRADFKKTRARYLEGAASEDPEFDNFQFDDVREHRWGSVNHYPNRFYYVVLDGEVEVGDIPDYAGYIRYRYDEDGVSRLRKMKKAPELHDNKVSGGMYRIMARRLFFHYWKNRLGESRV